jgi:hypothetical protein
MAEEACMAMPVRPLSEDTGQATYRSPLRRARHAYGSLLTN